MPVHPFWYAHEKFSSAVHYMATSPDLLRIRVFSAWRGHEGGTGLHALGEADLPPETQEQFKALRARLDVWMAADRDDDAWRVLADNESKRLADLICEIDGSIVHALVGTPRRFLPSLAPPGS